MNDSSEIYFLDCQHGIWETIAIETNCYVQVISFYERKYPIEKSVISYCFYNTPIVLFRSENYLHTIDTCFTMYLQHKYLDLYSKWNALVNIISFMFEYLF